jgi:hypothetical protein
MISEHRTSLLPLMRKHSCKLSSFRQLHFKDTAAHWHLCEGCRHAGQLLGPDGRGVAGVTATADELQVGVRAERLRDKYLAAALGQLMLAEAEYNMSAAKLLFKLKPAKINGDVAGALACHVPSSLWPQPLCIRTHGLGVWSAEPQRAGADDAGSSSKEKRLQEEMVASISGWFQLALSHLSTVAIADEEVKVGVHVVEAFTAVCADAANTNAAADAATAAVDADDGLSAHMPGPANTKADPEHQNTTRKKKKKARGVWDDGDDWGGTASEDENIEEEDDELVDEAPISMEERLIKQLLAAIDDATSAAYANATERNANTIVGRIQSLLQLSECLSRYVGDLHRCGPSLVCVPLPRALEGRHGFCVRYQACN